MKDKKKISEKLKNLINIKLLTIVVIFLLFFIPVTIMGVLSGYSYRTSSMKTEIAEIKGQCNMIASDISAGNYLIDQSSDVINAEIEQLAYTYSSRIIIINSEFTIVKDSYVFDEGKVVLTKDVFQAFKGKTTSSYNRKNGHGKVTVPIISEDGTVLGVIIANIINNNMIEILNYTEKVISAVKGGFIILVLIGAIIYAIYITKPTDILQNRIMDISAGDKNARVNTTSIMEYRRIGEAVNKLLDKLETIDNSREEFVSNVSHELKTPMASMKVLADSLLMQDNVPVEIYRDFMKDIVDEIDRENKIISDLLTLVKTDQTGTKLNIEIVNINELLELVLKRLKPIATEKKVSVTMESVRPVAAQVDKVKFTLVITNIVENAIKYNINNGWVRVTVNADHKYFYLDVSDSGIGIPSECKDQIFERFYRVDKARSREHGGTGLGLAITRSIVMLHKGTIRYYSKENEGTTFTIRVPLNYAGGKN